MTKIFFLFLATTWTCSLTWAYPRIGDKVQWKGSLQLRTGASSPVHITKEIVSFDDSTKKWRVKYVATVGDKVTTEFMETDDLYTPEKHKKVISGCLDQGGKLEDVATSIGKYQTCKITTQTATGMTVDKWWGDIPFGVVGRNTRDSGEMEAPDLNAIARDL